MSGGFFRGTSADQDTRFSNKHAKLLKSQKFAPELDHLADMTKIKMDVMRPWIAKRATEFLGFEDEVLINFIYGLLEGKNVNGKEIQISLTGFMEKNTAKFMKELWCLLISAQNNASGVPQQFLDAKVEETRKKKAESDKIANEIKKRCEKENRDVDQVFQKKMACDFDISRDAAAALAPGSRPMISNTFPVGTDKARETTQRNGFNRRSSDRKKSPSHSVSPEAHKHSISSGECDTRQRRYRSSHRQSARELTSPSRFISRQSTHYFQPYSNHNSPSPYMVQNKHFSSQNRPSSRIRYSHPRRKSNTPVRHISPSNSSVSHDSRSPYRRSSSPMLHLPSSLTRHGSPMRHDSPSPPIHFRSPSPIQLRSSSPICHRSLSPIYHRSPLPTLHRDPSPIHRRFSSRQRSPSIRRKQLSPVHHRSPYPSRHRSPSPYSRRSPSAIKYKQHYRYPSSKRHSSPSRRHRNPSVSPRGISMSHVSQSVYMYVKKGSPSSCPSRSRSLDQLSPSPIEQEFTPGGAMNHKKSPLLQEISLCYDHDNVENDDLVPIHKECKISTRRSHASIKSPQKDNEHFYNENTLSYISPDTSSKMTEGTTRQRELFGSSDTAKALPIKSLEVDKDLISSSMHKQSKSNYRYHHDPSYSRKEILKEYDLETKRRQCSDEMVESSKQRKCEVEKSGKMRWGSESDSEAESGRKKHNKKKVRKSSTSEDSEERKMAKKRRRAVRKEERRRRREERRRRKEEKRVGKQGKKKEDKDDDYCEEKRLEDELRKKAIESLRAKKGIHC